MSVQPPVGECDAEDDAGDAEGDPDAAPEGPREDVPRCLQRRGTHPPGKSGLESQHEEGKAKLCKHQNITSCSWHTGWQTV